MIPVRVITHRTRSRALAALVLSAGLAPSAPALAADLYSGHYGTAYTAYRAGGPYDDDRRALDGSYRTPPLLAMPGTWTGLYAGGHLGGGTGSFETSDLFGADLDLSTFLGGVHAGYNMQMGSYIAGLEVDGTWTSSGSDETTSGIFKVHANSDWLSSARLRLGYTSGQYMVYATGGIALADLDATLDAPGLDESLSTTMVGYAVGGGVEMKLTDSWIARVEALHYGFAVEELTSSAGTLDIETDVTTIRAGLSLRLN